MSGETNRADEPRLYQAVRCGPLRVAFPYGWASTIVEKFSVVSVPKAPSWLLGATNVGGQIFPVVDLSQFAGSNHRAKLISTEGSASTSRIQRLLLGGVNAENTENRLAILFEGLPAQIDASATKYEPSIQRPDAAPAMIDGTLVLANGERYARVSVDQLIGRLSAELSTL